MAGTISIDWYPEILASTAGIFSNIKYVLTGIGFDASVVYLGRTGRYGTRFTTLIQRTACLMGHFQK